MTSSEANRLLNAVIDGRFNASDETIRQALIATGDIDTSDRNPDGVIRIELHVGPATMLNRCGTRVMREPAEKSGATL